ncbi:MAG: VOC family protein [Bacteroidia bacterium]
MKLNHLNLVVTNIAETVSFFENYFNFKCTQIKGDNIIALLTGTDNFSLVLMTDKEGNSNYPKDFHIGFMLDTADEVNETYKKLKAGNVKVESEPRKIRDSFGFYFHFDNLFIEVGHYN